MWLTKEEKKKLHEKSIYKSAIEAVMVAEDQEIPVSSSMMYGGLWSLINEIVVEKWSLITGVFRGGDISENLLKRICKVLRERMEDEIKKRCNLEARLEWELDENSYTRVMK